MKVFVDSSGRKYAAAAAHSNRDQEVVSTSRELQAVLLLSTVPRSDEEITEALEIFRRLAVEEQQKAFDALAVQTTESLQTIETEQKELPI